MSSKEHALDRSDNLIAEHESMIPQADTTDLTLLKEHTILPTRTLHANSTTQLVPIELTGDVSQETSITESQRINDEANGQDEIDVAAIATNITRLGDSNFRIRNRAHQDLLYLCSYKKRLVEFTINSHNL